MKHKIHAAQGGDLHPSFWQVHSPEFARQRSHEAIFWVAGWRGLAVPFDLSAWLPAWKANRNRWRKQDLPYLLSGATQSPGDRQFVKPGTLSRCHVWRVTTNVHELGFTALQDNLYSKRNVHFTSQRLPPSPTPQHAAFRYGNTLFFAICRHNLHPLQLTTQHTLQYLKYALSFWDPADHSERSRTVFFNLCETAGR